MMQPVKVLVVIVALSQVECAPSSIWPSHRFSPPELWPFKQAAPAPAPLSVFTHFPAHTPSPSDIELPAETLLLVEPVIDSVNPIPAEVILEEPALPVEIIVPEVVEVESAPQPQEPIVLISEKVPLVQEVAPVIVTDVPVVTPTVTTTTPPSYQESETYQAYEQFINTWLQQASITLNRPDLLNMVTHPKQNIITPQASPAKPSVSKSVEKSVEKVVEQVTVSESVEPSVTPVEELSPEIIEISKKLSGPPKKTPVTVVTESATDAPIVADIDVLDVIAVEPALALEPIPSPEVTVLSEPMEATIIAADPAPESQNLESFDALKLVAPEVVPDNLPVQEQTISEVDLIAEPSFIQPVVVPQPAVQEFILAAEPQLTESSYSTISVSPQGTISVGPNPPATSSSSSNDAISIFPEDTAVNAESLSTAQPSMVEAALEPVQPAIVKRVLESTKPMVIDSFTPQGLTYTLRYFPRQGSSFFYSHALGG